MLTFCPTYLNLHGGDCRLAELAAMAGWQTASSVGELHGCEPAQVALLCLPTGSSAELARQMRRDYPHALLLTRDPQMVAEADLVLNADYNDGFLQKFLDLAQSHWRKNHKIYELVQDVAMRRQRMHQLNEISLALTDEMSQEDLLRTILSEAQRIAGCEGGSLFLVDASPQGEELVFKLAQNNVIDVPFVEQRLALTPQSIAGYVAIIGRELNIDDVYQLSDQHPYQFNRSFDEQMGYRTRSMLTIPMRDHRERVVGVLQFVNRTDPVSGELIPFGEEIAEVLRAIASQAAVSLQKNSLLEDINQLFEGFVQASVRTIEQRDPSTSGHSFRVAETTVALLQALPASGVSEFAGLSLSAEHIREVRYAALLHDFGKIGVPEAVLLKSHKLSAERLEVIQYRIELQKERLRRRAVEQELDLLHHQPIDQEVARRRVHRQLEKQISILDQYFDCVQMANNPNVIDAGDYAHLAEIRAYAFTELDGNIGGVITDQDVLALSVRRGSLTHEERRQIESHVVYTTEFLSTLPWPPELAGIPQIAGAHHERIDGSGYPNGLVGEQIPLASRVMAVCDVYDALTAMDRPYKPAISTERAFDILYDEAKRGLLDTSLVNIFIASGAHTIKATG